MTLTKRQLARQRTERLILGDHSEKFLFSTDQEKHAAPLKNIFTKRITQSLEQSGVRISLNLLLVVCSSSAVLLTLFAIKFFSPTLAPIFAVLGFIIPILWLEGRINKRAHEFSSDYPTVLLAMSSSIKVGHTAYIALERATRLLPENSIVRTETNKMLASLKRGEPREQAVADFGKSIRQPELELFRKAFLLVTENGGRFAPTLERLALVSKDRATLTSMARVSTTNMRMTANMLLLICPVVVGLIAVRTENYWDLFLNHPTASTLSTIGLSIIISSYALLQKMSAFKP